MLERGAVEGEIFHRGAVQALSDSHPVTPRLAALVRKGLIRPDTAQLPGDDAFRFRHLLFRDTAYDALPKATRAELHERLAAWLDQKGEHLVELDEILGFHLELAARYKAELGQPDPGLAERASEHLAAAGRRALYRTDYRAAAPLLERALELTRPLRLDVHLELALAVAQQVPRAASSALPSRRPSGLARPTTRSGRHSPWSSPPALRSQFADDPAVDELERLARAALPLLEQAEDDARTGMGLVRARRRRERPRPLRGVGAGRRAGPPPLPARRPAPLQAAGLPQALVLGPRPADEALRTLDSVLPANPHPGALLRRAELLAMLGRFDEAWALAIPAGERMRELIGDAGGENVLAEIAALAGEHAAAAGHLRRYCDMLERHGSRSLLSTYAPQLGRSLCALGRYDEAEPLAQLGRELGGEQDLATQMLWRQVQALIHAHRGEHAEAERLAREAVAIAERTDALNYQGDTLCDLAEVLAAAGRPDEATAALEQALERYKRKKNLAMLAQVRPKLEGLRKAATGLI